MPVLDFHVAFVTHPRCLPSPSNARRATFATKPTNRASDGTAAGYDESKNSIIYLVRGR